MAGLDARALRQMGSTCKVRQAQGSPTQNTITDHADCLQEVAPTHTINHLLSKQGSQCLLALPNILIVQLRPLANKGEEVLEWG